MRGAAHETDNNGTWRNPRECAFGGYTYIYQGMYRIDYVIGIISYILE